VHCWSKSRSCSPGKVPAEDLARVGADRGVAVERLVGKVDTDVVKDPVHDHVDVAVVALADEALEPRQLLGRREEVVRVARLDREVLVGGVAPVRMVAAPRGPRHEQDRVEAEVAEVVEAVNDRVERCPRCPVLRCEVVDHELVDVEVLQGAAAMGQRPHHVGRRRTTTDDHSRVVVVEDPDRSHRGYPILCLSLDLH